MYLDAYLRGKASKHGLFIVAALASIGIYLSLSWSLPLPLGSYVAAVVATLISRAIAPLSKWFYLFCFALIGPVATYLVMIPVIKASPNDPVAMLVWASLTSVKGIAEIWCPPLIAFAIIVAWTHIASRGRNVVG